MHFPIFYRLANKIRSSALFITGTTSCCFIAEDFLYMADAESFRPRWTDQIHKEQMSKLAMTIWNEMLVGIRESIDKAVREYVATAYRSLID